jgi:LCP family protein required for cell wall assembly
MPPVDTAITVAAGAPLNILVMGTDDRSGENGNIGGLAGAQGARSDSTLVVHISGNRDWITAVSIPRDTIVNIPSCPTSSGKYIQAHPATRFNAAFAYGASAGRDVASGALCTLTTVEAITNIHLDGFIVLDMAGFAAMVDALGGVEMDIPNRISAPLAGGLQLDAGTQTLDGWHALQYARARTGVGLGGGSDLERIRRQQKLITAIADQALGSRLLTDSPRLFRFLDATTSSMTTSSNFATVSGLMELATALSAVELENIQFIMAPIYSNPENPNTVLFSSNAKYLWSALQRDSQPVGYK